MSLEFWNGVFHWGSMVLVALAFVFVAGSLWTSNLIRDRESAQRQRLETEMASTQSALRGQSARVGIPAGARREPAEPAVPRTLDASARAILLEALRQVNPDGPIELRAVSGSTTEPGTFARTLAAVIEEAGWTLAGEGGGSAFGVPPVGLLIRLSERGDVPRRATILEGALNRAGLGARIERLADMREGVVELMVGLQP